MTVATTDLLMKVSAKIWIEWSSSFVCSRGITVDVELW